LVLLVTSCSQDVTFAGVQLGHPEHWRFCIPSHTVRKWKEPFELVVGPIAPFRVEQNRAGM
jgi:hypothetical protein